MAEQRDPVAGYPERPFSPKVPLSGAARRGSETTQMRAMAGFSVSEPRFAGRHPAAYRQP